MAIPSCLVKPIYVSFFIGKNVKGEAQYTKPEKIFVQKENVTRFISRDKEGTFENYDRLINVPIGGKSSYINEQAHLWVDCEPNATQTNMDYIVARVGDIQGGNFIIYCNSLASSQVVLYYEDRGNYHPFILCYSKIGDGALFSCGDMPKNIFQIKLDYKNLVGFIPNNKLIRIFAGTKVWLTKPTSIDSTTNLLRCIDRVKTDNGWILKFEKVTQ